MSWRLTFTTGRIRTERPKNGWPLLLDGKKEGGMIKFLLSPVEIIEKFARLCKKYEKR
jgi:hypothetical protein